MAKFFFVFTVLMMSGLQAQALNNLDTCFSPGGQCDQKIVDYLNSAQNTIDMAIYSLSLDEIRAALVGAQKRGVQIRIVCDHSEAQSKTSIVTWLSQNGFTLKYGSQRGLMHDKFTIVDGQWVEAGSYNYTYSATNSNAENQIYINDSKVVASYQENFESLWKTGIPLGSSTP